MPSEKRPPGRKGKSIPSAGNRNRKSGNRSNSSNDGFSASFGQRGSKSSGKSRSASSGSSSRGRAGNPNSPTGNVKRGKPDFERDFAAGRKSSAPSRSKKSVKGSFMFTGNSKPLSDGSEPLRKSRLNRNKSSEVKIEGLADSSSDLTEPIQEFVEGASSSPESHRVVEQESPGGIKLAKYIADCGVTSRRKAEDLIRSGKIVLNGEIHRHVETRVIAGKDQVECEGIPLEWENLTEVYLLYKPRNCVSTLSDPEGRPTIRDFFPRTTVALKPAGRLDFDTEGLIIITNNGRIIQNMMHPSQHIPKVYLVKVKGIMTKGEIKNLNVAPVMDGKKRQPVQVRFLHNVNDKTWLEITLLEGVNRQIKRMLEKIGYPVVKIKRVAVGNLDIANMLPGQYRKLHKREYQEFLDN